MRSLLICVVSILLATGAVGCKKEVAPLTFASPDQKVLYELMVERCDAINARDVNRLKKIYVKNSPDLDWLIKEGLPDFSRWGISHEVSEMKKITIVGVDAAGAFTLQLSGRLARNPVAHVDVLYIRDGTQWKIESVAEEGK